MIGWATHRSGSSSICLAARGQLVLGGLGPHQHAVAARLVGRLDHQSFADCSARSARESSSLHRRVGTVARIGSSSRKKRMMSGT